MIANSLIDKIAQALSDTESNQYTNESLGKQRMQARAVLQVISTDTDLAITSAQYKFEALEEIATKFEDIAGITSYFCSPEVTEAWLNAAHHARDLAKYRYSLEKDEDSL